ncbi:MAG: hypothetical protein ACLPSW_13960 [Roseiarcus sp.]
MHEATLRRAAAHSLGRNKGDIGRLLKHRRKRLKPGDSAGEKWFDELTELYDTFHSTLELIISSPERGSRQDQIREMLEYQLTRANSADLGDCPPIPRTVIRDLLEWAREQA